MTIANYQIPPIESIRLMGPPHEPLTFRDVTEVYRRERRSKDVTDIRRDFYPALMEFLDELRKDNEEEMSQDPFSLKSLSISDTMKKVRSKAVQIFEMRAEKILLMALRASSGAKVETEKLTREERAMYADTLELLSSNRNALLFQQKPQKPVPAQPHTEVTVPEEETEVEVQIDDVLDLPEEILIVETTKADLDEVGASVAVEPVLEDQLLVRVLEDIPSFAGPERDYVLSKEDVVMLPSVIARALVSRGKAVQVMPSAKQLTL
jgi:DNA replication initiation complex subunit (GINS family)